jgi:hypothetical protein
MDTLGQEKKDEQEKKMGGKNDIGAPGKIGGQRCG